jgi:fumarate reductase subunit C
LADPGSRLEQDGRAQQRLGGVEEGKLYVNFVKNTLLTRLNMKCIRMFSIIALNYFEMAGQVEVVIVVSFYSHGMT